MLCMLKHYEIINYDCDYEWKINYNFFNIEVVITWTNRFIFGPIFIKFFFLSFLGLEFFKFPKYCGRFSRYPVYSFKRIYMSTKLINRIKLVLYYQFLTLNHLNNSYVDFCKTGRLWELYRVRSKIRLCQFKYIILSFLFIECWIRIKDTRSWYSRVLERALTEAQINTQEFCLCFFLIIEQGQDNSCVSCWKASLKDAI